MKYLFIKLLNFINKITKYSICFFILFFIRILRPLILIKFDSSHSSRIGHFSGINSLYISEKINTKAKKQIEFFIHESSICNSHMETLLKRKIFFLPNYFYPILIINNWIRGGNKHLIHYRSNYIDKRVVFEHRDIKNLNDTTSAPVQFSNEEINLAKNEIKKIGINENDKIIILNIRDRNYLKIIYPKNNWNYKTQNSNIQSYKKTVQYLLNKGYKVVRCGLHHQETLNIIDKNFIDLFNIGVRTALIENYLTSICLFQIGSYSGGTIPAQFMFRKPIIYCNFIPINELHLSSKKVYLILKKIYDKQKKRNITTSEYFDLLNTNFGPLLVNTVDDDRFQSNVKFENQFSKYQKKDFEIIDNTQDEILDIVSEVLKTIESSSLYEKDTNIENKIFREVFLKNLDKYQTLKKFHSLNINSKIGQKFLQKNQNFLL